VLFSSLKFFYLKKENKKKKHSSSSSSSQSFLKLLWEEKKTRCEKFDSSNSLTCEREREGNFADFGRKIFPFFSGLII